MQKMQNILRYLGLLGGFIMLGMGIGWVVNPEFTAASLQMSLLEGPGLNSQLGDTTSFFLGTGLFAIVGIWQKRPDLLLAAIVLMGGVAVWRIFGGLVHEAPILWGPVATEVVFSAIWYGLWRDMKS